MQMEEELKRLTISNHKYMGVVEELQKANQTLKLQLDTLKNDTHLPSVTSVESLICSYLGYC